MSLFSTNPMLPSPSPNEMFNVDGMIAVVTGGGTGIGLMMATALEENGAIVYIVGRRFSVLQKAAEDNNKFGNIIPIECDVTNRESLIQLEETIKANHGYINLLINNAGIARNLYVHPLPSPTSANALATPPASPGPSSASHIPSIKSFQHALWDTGSPEDFAETFATNVTACYYTTVALLELLHNGNTRQQVHSKQLPTGNGLMRPPHHTSQVLTISSSGSFRLDAQILSPSYTLAKCACTHLGKLLANLLAPWGIRSNVLAPGVFPSEMTYNKSEAKFSPESLANSVPLKRAGTSEDIAGTILFLVSRAGAYVNGAVWLVDGGRVGGVASSYS